DGLGGEVLDQFNLFIGEGTYLLPVNEDGANQLLLSKHWHADCGSRSTKLGRQADRSVFRGIGSMNDLFRAHGTIEQSAWCRANRQALPLSFGQLRRCANPRGKVKDLAFEAEQ